MSSRCRSRILPAVLVASLLAVCCAAPAWADGGQSIASAPTVVYGQQAFGNTANGRADSDACTWSWWSLGITSGDQLKVDWETQATTHLLVFPVGTTDFNLTSATPLQEQGLQEAGSSGNGHAELSFTAPASGTMPVAFKGNCWDYIVAPVGPYDFTAFVRHVVRLSLPGISKLRRSGRLKVIARNADGGVILDSGLRVDVQVRNGRSWLTIGNSRLATTIAYRVPTRFVGERVRIRAVAHGSSYLSAASRSRGVIVLRTDKRRSRAVASRTRSIPTRIVVGQGMAGVRLGDSQKRVRKVLGKPASQDGSAGGAGSWNYPKTLMGVIGFDQHGRVNGIWTGSPKQKTNKGIGPRATSERFKRAYPRAHCFTSKGLKWTLVCQIRGHFHKHRVVTTFSFAVTLSEVEVDLQE